MLYALSRRVVQAQESDERSAAFIAPVKNLSPVITGK